MIDADDVLPAILREDLDTAIAKWIEFFHKAGQLCFRPFLRWFDRNLQEVFVESLRKIKRLQEQSVVFVAQPNGPAQQPSSPASPADDGGSDTSEELDANVKSIQDDLNLIALPKKHERLKLELEDLESLDVTSSAKPACKLYDYGKLRSIRFIHICIHIWHLRVVNHLFTVFVQP